MKFNTTTLCQILGQEPEAADVAAVGDMIQEYLGDEHLAALDAIRHPANRRAYVAKHRLETFSYLGSMPARCAAFMAASGMRLPCLRWDEDKMSEITRLTYIFIAMTTMTTESSDPLFSKRWWAELMHVLDLFAENDLWLEERRGSNSDRPQFHVEMDHFLTLWAAWELKR